MKTYIVIETEDVEIIGLSVFADQGKAVEHYEKVRDENGEHDWAKNELRCEVEGTLRMAGDDAYAVQLVEKEVLTA